MVWMRVAAVSNFRKLWGRIEQDVEAGEYLLTISNSNIIFVIFIGNSIDYDVSKFHGKKFIILSNANFFGGKNRFLSLLYFLVGFISLMLGCYFIVKRPLINKKLEAVRHEK